MIILNWQKDHLNGNTKGTTRQDIKKCLVPHNKLVACFFADCIWQTADVSTVSSPVSIIATSEESLAVIHKFLNDMCYN
jgi:hypothetical protein